MSGDAAQHNGMDIHGVLYSNNVYLENVVWAYTAILSNEHNLTANWDSHEVLPQQVHTI